MTDQDRSPATGLKPNGNPSLHDKSLWERIDDKLDTPFIFARVYRFKETDPRKWPDDIKRVVDGVNPTQAGKKSTSKPTRSNSLFQKNNNNTKSLPSSSRSTSSTRLKPDPKQKSKLKLNIKTEQGSHLDSINVAQDVAQATSNQQSKTDGKDCIERQQFITKLTTLFPGPELTVFNDVDDQVIPHPPNLTQYVNQYLYRNNVKKPRPQDAIGCSCLKCGQKKSEICICFCDAAGNDECSYWPDGRCKYAGLIYECNDACACGNDCISRVVQNGRRIPLELFKTRNKGWGIRSTQAIPQGTFVLTYPGELITNEEATRRITIAETNTAGDVYIFDIDGYCVGGEEPEYAVDAERFGGLARFFNHSCDPNLMVIPVAIGHHMEKFHELAFFTSRDVEPYEELCFTYAKANISTINLDGPNDDDKDNDKDDDKDDDVEELNPFVYSQKCYCGAPNCKGLVWFK
ncbi:hypothetical protein V1514DRAFT_332087 [Lipomyces japonicus]|uniref:uncharacterized protein n=1 Tax=Lipomyces japonicus TaxID=56871 RepID=UPI0034CF50ED